MKGARTTRLQSPFASSAAAVRTAYGQVAHAPQADVYAKAFGALRGLGFREREACHALARLQRQALPAASIEDVIRGALKILSEAI